MIYLFLGSDFNIVNKKVNELISSLEIDNIIKYDYSECELSDILNEVNYVDLFNEKKLLVVSSFSLKKIKDKDEELLVSYINNMTDNAIILKCIDESLDERKKITKLLREKCKVTEVKKLDYKTLHEYIDNMFKENNVNASFSQIKKILDLCEYNPDYTISEVEKLLIYKIGEDTLYDEDIDNVISKNTEKEMFNLIDSVLRKDLSSSLKSFKTLVSGNTDEIVILDNLAKQYRLLMQLCILRGELSELDLARKLGVNPYVIKKLLPYTRDYKIEQIADILYTLSETDINIKINGIDKYRALESFFIGI